MIKRYPDIYSNIGEEYCLASDVEELEADKKELMEKCKIVTDLYDECDDINEADVFERAVFNLEQIVARMEADK